MFQSKQCGLHFPLLISQKFASVRVAKEGWGCGSGYQLQVMLKFSSKSCVTDNLFQYNTIQYNLFPPEVIPTVWLHTFAVSDD